MQFQVGQTQPLFSWAPSEDMSEQRDHPVVPCAVGGARRWLGWELISWIRELCSLSPPSCPQSLAPVSPALGRERGRQGQGPGLRDCSQGDLFGEWT